MKVEEQDDTGVEEGCIRFELGDGTEEVMRFEPGGNIYVRGKLVENDKDVVDGLRAFLAAAGYMPRRDEDSSTDPSS